MNTTASDIKRLIVFDLDDTLFHEAEFLASARREIARRISERYSIPAPALLMIMSHPGEGENAFDALDRFLKKAIGENVEESIKWMVNLYRTHKPDISLDPGVRAALAALADDPHTLTGLITRGRLTTQMNKIEALGLRHYLSIPPSICTQTDSDDSKSHFFRHYDKAVTGQVARISVGDNPPVDFAEPNRLGWITVAVADHGHNIHPQDLDTCPAICRPDHVIDSVADLPALLEKIGV